MLPILNSYTQSYFFTLIYLLYSVVLVVIFCPGYIELFVLVVLSHIYTKMEERPSRSVFSGYFIHLCQRKGLIRSRQHCTL